MYKLAKINNNSIDKKKARDSFSYLDREVGSFSSREHEILQENNTRKSNQ